MTQTDQKGRAMRAPRAWDNKTKSNVSDGAPSVEDVRRLEAESARRRNTMASPKGVADIERILNEDAIPSPMVERLRAAGHIEAAAGLASYEEAREFFGVSVGELKASGPVREAAERLHAEEISTGKFLEIVMVELLRHHKEAARHG